MQTFDTPAPISAVVDIPAGRIQVIGADRSDTIVEVRPTRATSSRDVKVAERVEVTYDDGVLRIATREVPGRLVGASGSVAVTVRLPAGSRVEATAAGADLRGVGRLGDVSFTGAQGSVQLDETAGARLTLQSGDVTVGRLGGPAQISTQHGDLHITEAVSGPVTLRTGHGDIRVGAARGTTASLDAGTSYGRIDNALGGVTGPGADLTIHATTAHGDITARSL